MNTGETTMETKTLIGDGDTFELEGLRFKCRIRRDEFKGPPWKEHDGHGPVIDWTNRKKLPGEWVLSVDGNSHQFYDFAEAVKIARRDGWGVKDSEGKSKGQIAVEAVKADFKYLKAWCDDEWEWVYVTVYLLDADGRRTDIQERLGGIESSEDSYLSEVAMELAGEIAHRMEGEDEIRIPIRKVGEDERKAVADKLAAHYSAKINGKVWCTWEEEKHAYEIRGEGLPAANPELYPKGWSMLDYVTVKEANEILKPPADPVSDTAST